MGTLGRQAGAHLKGEHSLLSQTCKTTEHAFKLLHVLSRALGLAPSLAPTGLRAIHTEETRPNLENFRRGRGGRKWREARRDRRAAGWRRVMALEEDARQPEEGRSTPESARCSVARFRTATEQRRGGDDAARDADVART